MRNTTRQLLAVTVTLLCLSEPLLAQRGGRGGGGRGGGGGMRGGGGGRSMPSRSVSRPSVSRPSGGGGFGGGSISRPAGNPGGNIDRGNINRGDINRGNINVDRGNINVGDVDIDGGRWNGGCCYHPVARAAAWGTAAAVTAAAVGSVIYSLPSSCTVVYVGDDTYQQCGSTWYHPQFVGTTTSYVVVSPPQ